MAPICRHGPARLARAAPAPAGKCPQRRSAPLPAGHPPFPRLRQARRPKHRRGHHEGKDQILRHASLRAHPRPRTRVPWLPRVHPNLPGLLPRLRAARVLPRPVTPNQLGETATPDPAKRQPRTRLRLQRLHFRRSHPKAPQQPRTTPHQESHQNKRKSRKNPTNQQRTFGRTRRRQRRRSRRPRIRQGRRRHVGRGRRGQPNRRFAAEKERRPKRQPIVGRRSGEARRRPGESEQRGRVVERGVRVGSQSRGCGQHDGKDEPGAAGGEGQGTPAAHRKSCRLGEHAGAALSVRG
uniref:(northern house mosquito) hypothetical protein n=1 Tax=Culex pipiens TaxID=7175 RepID=A0A8D8FV98_CULPI